MRQFSEFIDELELIDLTMLGGNFTWSGGLRNQNMACLDRFLVSQVWIDHHGNVVQLKLPRPTSDHAPLLLDYGGNETRVDSFLLRKYVVKSGRFPRHVGRLVARVVLSRNN